jgi:PAP2 superfamily
VEKYKNRFTMRRLCFDKLQATVFLMLILAADLVTTLVINNSSAALNGSSNPVVSWNELATKLASLSKLPPTKLARAYSLLHVAMYDSILDARNTNNTMPVPATSVISGSASRVLSFLFPNGTVDINKLKNFQLLAAMKFNDNNTSSKGLLLGDQVGQNIIKYAKNDGSNLPFSGPFPVGKCIWNGTNPVTPMAGHWKTYILKSGAEIQPPPPAICGSNEDKVNVQGILQASHSRTTQQIAAVHRWGDMLPPVIWNNILNQLININHLSIFDAARISAYLNIAMYDAFVSTWYTKYTHWTARPFQRIANFTTVISTPNFPGYTSGHSTISAAAVKVLDESFPNERSHFNNLLIEASLSRFWAGIHFKEDIYNGMNVGSAIGEKIVNDMHKVPHLLVSLN